ncbi:MAG: DUF1924 domain-containing protein [Hahellaceae bacterium]|nr:DUF1924 domain-containing protein [Hahellaceae bacterium]MCP5168227.1 DUF1924 domain-containing protein [Hahellaceae bacterium]
MALASFAAIAGESAIKQLLTDYQQQGAGNFDSARGQRLWESRVADSESFALRSCTTCHGADLKKPGQHVKTKKAIEPMAPSANATRLRKQAEIEKWLLRNCKWTFGRECSAQEKGDMLVFLQSQ